MSPKKPSTKKVDRVQPACPKSGYSFVAAGNLFKSFGGYTVYVKYKGGDAHKITVKEESNYHIWLRCPDREIVIVKNTHDTAAFYPSGESFDEVYDFNTFNDEVTKSMGIEYVMTNYAHSLDYMNGRYPTTLPPNKRIQVLSDSGGLQLARGVKELIDPHELIEFYNNNVDAGMVLDLPLHFSDMEICKKAATVQRKNTDVMLANSKQVELINIFHGESLKERQLYRSIVEDPKVPRVAIAGVGRLMPISGVNAVCETIEGGIPYKQYHVLGVYTASYVPLLVKLANTGDNPRHITSDSTSHIQSAINKAYHFQFDVFHNMKRVPIGTRGALQNTRRYLPCQCPVCRVLKYMDVLGFIASRHVSELLALHNAYEMTRYAKQLEEFCRASTPKEYNSLVERQLKGYSDLKELKFAMDYIDMYGKHGLKAAQKKYGTSHVNRVRHEEDKVPQGLFSTAKAETKEEDKKSIILKQISAMNKKLKERS